MAGEPREPRKLITPKFKRIPGNDTVSLYCDECGEIYCEHRPRPAVPSSKEPTE